MVRPGIFALINYRFVLLALAGALAGGLAVWLSGPERVSLRVNATAYTSTPGQTQGDPFLAAWNNRLEPGMKALAVSRDLLKKGLANGSKVKVEGYGTYTVLDKMNRRYKRRVDLYFGTRTQAAREFGRREVTITFTPAETGRD